jgi:SNF2 family DNA or RNA helicase
MKTNIKAALEKFCNPFVLKQKIKEVATELKPKDRIDELTEAEEALVIRLYKRKTAGAILDDYSQDSVKDAVELF